LGQLTKVAQALGPLLDQVVFIGGAIAPLLHTAPPFSSPRPTSDVDGVIATTTYADAHEKERQLAGIGFRRDLSDTRHAYRWYSPDGVPFDLVPSGKHLGASGNRWDDIAIATAVKEELEQGLTIRHATAPAFLALKWAAHLDRGRNDPLASHDLEDILALVASRPTLVDEILAAPDALRSYLAEQARVFLVDPYAEDLLAAHLNNAQDPVRAISVVRQQLERTAEL
jgi:predicted nucleotidyltransferase